MESDFSLAVHNGCPINRNPVMSVEILRIANALLYQLSYIGAPNVCMYSLGEPDGAQVTATAFPAKNGDD